ncbi:MAG: hypothetical protein ACR2M0_12645 [Chloroflexia bacterium]
MSLDHTQPSASEPPYGWIFLGGLALIIALLDPIVFDLRTRLDLSLALLALGELLLVGGLLRRVPALLWAGAVVLWAVVVAGLCTQTTMLGIAPNLVWAPRGALLVGALLGWALLMAPPPWLWRGTLAVALLTLVALGVLWITAPPFARTARVTWMAADSRGTLYATDGDSGAIWVFDSNGGVRGKLLPRRASAPNVPGPGVQSAGVGSELSVPASGPTPTPGGPTVNEFGFCGIAADPQDHLYVPDILLRRVLDFDRDGQLRAVWALPDTYSSVGSCVAADAEHVYMVDSQNQIYVYDHSGKLLTSWPLSQRPSGISAVPGGRMAVLYDRAVELISLADGRHLAGWDLPPAGPLEDPYQAVVGLENGEIWVSDLLNGHLLRYSATGAPLDPVGAPGNRPGEFSAPGSMAVDPQDRVFVADSNYRLVQRFLPDGHADAIWAAPENEADLR